MNNLTANQQVNISKGHNNIIWTGVVKSVGNKIVTVENQFGKIIRFDKRTKREQFASSAATCLRLVD